MYYLFKDSDTNRYIQLTFAGQRVATYTIWSDTLSDSPNFLTDPYSAGNWSSTKVWLSGRKFTLLATSSTPITPLTHPELLI